jgi:hypothetical protein
MSIERGPKALNAPTSRMRVRCEGSGDTWDGATGAAETAEFEAGDVTAAPELLREYASSSGCTPE